MWVNETIENDHNMVEKMASKWKSIFDFILLFRLLRCSEKSSRYFVWRTSTKQDKNVGALEERRKNDLLIIAANGMDIIPFIEQKQNTTLSLDSRARFHWTVLLWSFARSFVRCILFYFYFLLLVRSTCMFCCVACLHLCWSILCAFFLHHISDRHLIYRPLKNEI